MDTAPLQAVYIPCLGGTDSLSRTSHIVHRHGNRSTDCAHRRVIEVQPRRAMAITGYLGTPELRAAHELVSNSSDRFVHFVHGNMRGPSFPVAPTARHPYNQVFRIILFFSCTPSSAPGAARRQEQCSLRNSR